MSPVEVIEAIIAGMIAWVAGIAVLTPYLTVLGVIFGVAALALAVYLGPTICLARKIYARVDRLDAKVDALSAQHRQDYQHLVSLLVQTKSKEDIPPERFIEETP